MQDLASNHQNYPQSSKLCQRSMVYVICMKKYFKYYFSVILLTVIPPVPINFHPPWHTLSFISNALIKEPPYLRSCWVWLCEYSLTLSSASAAAPHFQVVCLPHQSFSSFTCSPSLLVRDKNNQPQPTLKSVFLIRIGR